MIAIVDGAPYAEHPALRGTNLEVLRDGIGRDPPENDAASSHATFLASMFVASRNECLGLCPACRLMCIAAVDSAILKSDAPPRRAAEQISGGIMVAVESGAQIIQISLELGFGDASAAATLLATLHFCRSKSIVVVLAAGHGQLRRPNQLLWVPGVIPVFPSDESGNAPYDQRWGTLMAVRGLSAPGTRIPGACLPTGVQLRIGSSFACSFVSAAIALQMAALPGLTAAQAAASLFLPRAAVFSSAYPQPLDVDQSFNQFKLN